MLLNAASIASGLRMKAHEPTLDGKVAGGNQDPRDHTVG